MGDWREMEPAQAGWPQTGGRNPFLSTTADIALTGLSEAVFDGAPLAGVLTQITQHLDSAATQYAASVG